MVYVPIAAGLVAAFCWGTADYLSRSQSQKLGYYRTVLYSHIVTLVMVLAMVPLVDPAPVFEAAPVLALAVAGLLNLVAFILLYRAFHRGVVSVVAPIAYTYPAITSVLSVAILGTVISSGEVLAIGGVIVGVVLLSTRFSELRSLLSRAGPASLTAGVGSALGSSVIFGGVYVVIGYAAPLVSIAVPVIMLRVVALAAGFALAPVLKQDVEPVRAAFSKVIIIMGGLEAAGFLTFTYGILSASGSLPIVAAIGGMGGAVAAAYGLVFLKERLEANQMAGVVLALVGVFTLLYLGG